MSLKALEYPKSISVKSAAAAWGLDPAPLHQFSNGETLSSHEIRKFLMKTTSVLLPGKSGIVLKQYFIRFMVLSLKYPLIEDTQKAILQMLDRDYLKPDDEVLYRSKCNAFMTPPIDNKKVQKYLMDYYAKSHDDYIAQFPKQLLMETLQEVPVGTRLNANSKVSLQMTVNLAICVNRMGDAIALIPFAEEVSREIIEANPLMKTLNPVIGSLRMRRSVADLHTNLAVGG